MLFSDFSKNGFWKKNSVPQKTFQIFMIFIYIKHTQDYFFKKDFIFQTKVSFYMYQ